jgi:hypothetical protein
MNPLSFEPTSPYLLLSRVRSEYEHDNGPMCTACGAYAGVNDYDDDAY